MDSTTAKKVNSGAFKKGEKKPNQGKRGPGKVTTAAKDAIAAAAEALGGVARLAEWAGEDPANERIFWGTIYPKLLPLQVTGADGRTLAQELAALNGRPE